MTVERLDQDTITATDGTALLNIYQQNQPELAGYWPGTVPNPQTRLQLLALFPKEIMRVRVDRVAGVIIGFMATTRTPTEYVAGLYLRLRDANTNIALTPAQRRALLRASAVRLGRDWFNAGGTDFQVNYPTNGHASMVAFLDDMSAANGVTPEVVGSMRIYRWKARDGNVGLDAITP